MPRVTDASPERDLASAGIQSAHDDRPGGRCKESGQNFEEGCLPRTVGPEKGQPVAWEDFEGNISKRKRST